MTKASSCSTVRGEFEKQDCKNEFQHGHRFCRKQINAYTLIPFDPSQRRAAHIRPCWASLATSGDRAMATQISARLVSFDQKRTELTPGTVLVREWDRRSQRVMVMSDGFAWKSNSVHCAEIYLSRPQLKLI